MSSADGVGRRRGWAGRDTGIVDVDHGQVVSVEASGSSPVVITAAGVASASMSRPAPPAAPGSIGM